VVRNPKIGTWKWDSGTYKKGHGNYDFSIEQLRKMDPNKLIPGEEIDWHRKNVHAPRYAQWLKQGKKAPPISALETPDGQIKIIDGHRRWLAHKATGKKILVWVNPDYDKGLALNREKAVRQAIAQGKKVPDEVRKEYGS
jgi:hypothetical protein